MRARIIGILTAAALIGGTAGAFAFASAGGGGPTFSAAVGQYCPPKARGLGCRVHRHPHHGRHAAFPTPPPSAPPPGVPPVVITARYVRPYGFILVNRQGHTLYAFTGDRPNPTQPSKVTCVGTCAAVFPPTFLPPGSRIVAASPLRLGLFGSEPDPSGGLVVTYNDWPLYTYLRDRVPGAVGAEGAHAFGGYWYVISPAGQLLKPR